MEGSGENGIPRPIYTQGPGGSAFSTSLSATVEDVARLEYHTLLGSIGAKVYLLVLLVKGLLRWPGHDHIQKLAARRHGPSALDASVLQTFCTSMATVQPVSGTWRSQRPRIA